MDQQNQFNQPNNSQGPQQSFQSKGFKKKTALPTWVIILIAVGSVVVVGVATHDLYQCFIAGRI